MSRRHFNMCSGRDLTSRFTRHEHKASFLFRVAFFLLPHHFCFQLLIIKSLKIILSAVLFSFSAPNASRNKKKTRMNKKAKSVLEGTNEVIIGDKIIVQSIMMQHSFCCRPTDGCHACRGKNFTEFRVFSVAVETFCEATEKYWFSWLIYGAPSMKGSWVGKLPSWRQFSPQRLEFIMTSPVLVRMPKPGAGNLVLFAFWDQFRVTEGRWWEIYSELW